MSVGERCMSSVILTGGLNDEGVHCFVHECKERFNFKQNLRFRTSLVVVYPIQPHYVG
jgi:hypothetical protein